MRKNYVSATQASHLKTKPPVNIRDRVIRLTETVNELKANVEYEERQKDNMEKVTSQNYSALNNQIKSLKKAFNTLADVVMEELDSFKGEIFKDFQDSNDVVYRKMDDMASQIYKLQTEKQEQKAQLISLDQELRDRFRSIEKRQEESYAYLQSTIEANKEDNKVLFEKLKILANNNTAQLELLSRDNEKIHSELNDSRAKTINDSSSFKVFQKRIAELEELVRATREELNERMVENKELSNSMRQTNKGEVQSLLKGQADLHRKFEEISSNIIERMETNKLVYDHKFVDFERSLSHLQQEFQENVEELARIHKDSSTQIIMDFEKAITALNSDTKVIFKKFGNVEENLVKTKDELSTMLKEQQHTLGRKNDQFEKTIYEICRKLNISNPFLAY